MMALRLAGGLATQFVPSDVSTLPEVEGTTLGTLLEFLIASAVANLASSVPAAISAAEAFVTPAAGVALVQFVPFDVSTLPDVEGATRAMYNVSMYVFRKDLILAQVSFFVVPVGASVVSEISTSRNKSSVAGATDISVEFVNVLFGMITSIY